MRNSRCLWHPNILADLTAYQKSIHALRFQQNVGAEGNGLTIKKQGNCLLIPGEKVPRLIKFPIGGDKGFGNKSKDLSVMDCRRHIIKLSLSLKGKPDKHKRILPLRMVCNKLQLLPAGG